jgi:hypothetical protein
MREAHGKKHLEVVSDMRLTGEAWRNTRFGIPDRSKGTCVIILKHVCPHG